MLDVEVIDDPAAAMVALEPIRNRLLAELGEPASAATLAARLGIARQKLNYHLRALEAHGLAEVVGERRWGGLTERLLVATAESYVVSPVALGAIAADPGMLLARYNRANLLAERGDYDAAAADLDKILRAAPDDVGSWISRGRIHGMRGDHVKAIADNGEALKRAPDDARIANNLAWLLATAPRAELRDGPRALFFRELRVVADLV